MGLWAGLEGRGRAGLGEMGGARREQRAWEIGLLAVGAGLAGKWAGIGERGRS